MARFRLYQWDSRFHFIFNHLHNKFSINSISTIARSSSINKIYWTCSININYVLLDYNSGISCYYVGKICISNHRMHLAYSIFRYAWGVFIHVWSILEIRFFKLRIVLAILWVYRRFGEVNCLNFCLRLCIFSSFSQNEYDKEVYKVGFWTLLKYRIYK